MDYQTMKINYDSLLTDYFLSFYIAFISSLHNDCSITDARVDIETRPNPGDNIMPSRHGSREDCEVMVHMFDKSSIIDTGSDEEEFARHFCEVPADDPCDNNRDSVPNISIHSEDSDENDNNNEDDLFTDDLYKNWIMFQASNMTVNHIFTMVQAVCLRFKLSDETRHTLLTMMKLIAGPKFRNLNCSKYLMAKTYNPPEEVKKYVFYCKTCAKMLTDLIPKSHFMTKNKTVVCEKCLAEYRISTSSEHWFISIDLEHQIRTLLGNPNIMRALRKNIRDVVNVAVDSDIISDVYSGENYKNDIYIQSKKKEDTIVLTLNVNVDGAPIFTTSTKSLWPVQAILNELSVYLRQKHVLLPGVWWPDSEPTPALMNLYMTTFVNQVQRLMDHGILMKNDEGDMMTIYVKVFNFPVDAPARALLQNRISHSGYLGCSSCYIHGDYISAVRFLLKTIEPDEDRTHEKYLKDIETLHKLKRQIQTSRITKKDEKMLLRQSRGSKGDSVLTSLPYFDCVWGFPSEYLHGVLLGPTKQLWDAWKNPKNKRNLPLWARKLVGERLIGIRPTDEIHRVPRLLKDRAKWRGHEWKWWLIHYSLPCLKDLLPLDALESYGLFVPTIHMLLRAHITEEELIQCKIDLIQFVAHCQVWYGEEFMTFNVHCLLHLVDSVKKNGPLSVCSAFGFESNIGPLKQSVTGSKGVSEQIANRALQLSTFKNIAVPAITDNVNVYEFCSTIFNHRTVNSSYYQSRDGALLTGALDSKLPSSQYSRCKFENVTYHSIAYDRVKKTNNTIVMLRDGRILEIHSFCVIENACNIIGRELYKCTLKLGNTAVSHIKEISELENEIVVIPITEIKTKIVYVQVGKVENLNNSEHKSLVSDRYDSYACEMPNTFEVQ